MENSDGSSGDAVMEGSEEELDALITELEGYEQAFNAFSITGYGMTGDSTHGFSYEP